MAYEFKKLSAVEAVESPADTANVLIEEDGVIKKTPFGAFTGSGGDVFVVPVTVTTENGRTVYRTTADHQAAVDAAKAGKPICMHIVKDQYTVVMPWLTGCSYDWESEWYVITCQQVSGKYNYRYLWYPDGTINYDSISFATD
jgi:hypothetical protein